MLKTFVVKGVVVYLHLGCKQVYKIDASNVPNRVRLNKLAVKTYALDLAIFGVLGLGRWVGVELIDNIPLFR